MQQSQLTSKLKIIKKELEVMYKELIRVMFDQTPAAGKHEETVAKSEILPLERKINTLIMKINDQMEELESLPKVPLQ
jgi:hypothetical protein